MKCVFEQELTRGVILALLSPDSKESAWKDIRSGCLFKISRPPIIYKILGNYCHCSGKGSVEIENGMFFPRPIGTSTKDELLRDWLEFLLRKNTKFLCKAMSCGAILATFGAEGMRYADPDATFMIHEVSLGAFGKTEEVTASAEEGRRLNEKVLKMMARNCGQDESYFIDQIHDRKHADWFLTADEAHQIGMVNHVRVPKMQLDVTAKWSFK